MPVPTRVVLLDLDGTLTDSAPGIVNCLRYALDELGIEHPDDATIRTFLGPPLAVTFREHFGMDDAGIALAIAKYRERYHDVGLFENAVYDGIPGLLDDLAGSGITLAVATSKPTVSATRILEHFGLADRMAFIGGAELDRSRDTKALVIGHVLGELGIDPAVARRLAGDGALVMVGDREHDVHGAREHGIGTMGVLWGYGSEAELQEAGVLALADTPAALGATLLAR